MNKLESIYKQAQSASEYAKRYLDHLSKIIDALDHDQIAAVINLIDNARENDKAVFVIGNGGSAATASHLANDFGIGTRSRTKPFRVISLTDNNAVMTAIANDFGYENLFVKQLESVYSKGDLLIAISASGNSPNVINAVEWVKKSGGITIGFTGFNGGKLKELSDHCIHAQTDIGEFGPVEDVHMILDHLIGTYLMFQCREEH